MCAAQPRDHSSRLNALLCALIVGPFPRRQMTRKETKANKKAQRVQNNLQAAKKWRKVLNKYEKQAQQASLPCALPRDACPAPLPRAGFLAIRRLHGAGL